MRKALIIFVAAGSLIAGIFVWLHRPGPCAAIMEQTTQKLNLSVDVIKAKGALVIGGEKVQDVSENALNVGKHLTTCCEAQHSDHPLPPDQYLACVNGAKDYEAKIVQVTNVIIEADKAKQDGKPEVAEQKAAEAKTAVEASASIVTDLRKLAEAAIKPSQVPSAKSYFFDDFKGKTLADDWEVIRPEPDNYAIKKDGLLIINFKGGGLDQDNIPNLFLLKTAMPEGDWTATVKFSSEFPVAREIFYLALLQDKDHWTAATLYAATGCCSYRSLTMRLSRKSAAEPVSWEGDLSRVEYNDWNKFVSDNKLSQPIYLRLQRAGDAFIMSGRLETIKPDQWVTLKKIVSLHDSGNLVFGFVQTSGISVQTHAIVEWIKIETP